MNTARKYLQDVLAVILPETWDIYPYFGDVTPEAGRTQVQLILTSVDRHEQAPLSHHNVNFTVRLLSGQTDPERREDELEDNLDEILYAIQVAAKSLGTITWNSAVKGVTEDRSRMMYDIEVSVITQSHNPELSTDSITEE